MKPILNIENLTKIYGNVPSQTKALNRSEEHTSELQSH